MSKEFECFDVGFGQIGIFRTDLGNVNHSLELVRPVKLFFKQNGATNDLPSIAILSISPNISVCSEISLEMLNEGLADIGYELVKKEP